ncbi:Apolipoprotein O family-containing protein [Strongyloides ratti]|uniref:MICOS complex subunit n=1 Tax=Strongyloides ratti TaxID=34506 RepID=A0A090LNZ0_STRRB|nr:Apolipoprotein O family-containing protein [Strongyloides ratti]CEF69215.1 Apolipoprotein O family-containing protein [Strongyloides ratti]
MDYIEAAKNKTADFYKQWVRLSNMENKAPENLTTINDLPFYNDQKTDLTKYTYVEESPILLQKSVSVARQIASDQYSLISERFEVVNKFGKCVKKHYYNTKEYIEKEGTVIPKAAIITLGGISGFILYFRRYGLRKYFYATAGIGVMTAFCYPEETVDVVKTGYYHSLSAYEKFKEGDKKEKKH